MCKFLGKLIFLMIFIAAGIHNFNEPKTSAMLLSERYKKFQKLTNIKCICQKLVETHSITFVKSISFMQVLVGILILFGFKGNNFIYFNKKKKN